MKVGPPIRRLRQLRKLSQTELARRSQIGRITLVRIEAGTQVPTMATLERLARALGVRLSDLLDGGRR